jgi:hypothetical protein
MSKKAKNDSEPQSPWNDEAPEIESAYPKARPIGIKTLPRQWEFPSGLLTGRFIPGTA